MNDYTKRPSLLEEYQSKKGIKKPTLLQPYNTRIQIDGWIKNYKYLLEPNPDGLYLFSVVPFTYEDNQRVMELGETCVSRMWKEFDTKDSEWRRSFKTPEKSFENKDGSLLISQLFLPKITDQENYRRWIEKGVSLDLHFRDSVDCKIYLQCDYINPYDWEEFDRRRRGPDVPPPPGYDPSDDF